MNEKERVICEKLLDTIQSPGPTTQVAAISNYRLFLEATLLRMQVSAASPPTSLAPTE